MRATKRGGAGDRASGSDGLVGDVAGRWGLRRRAKGGLGLGAVSLVPRAVSLVLIREGDGDIGEAAGGDDVEASGAVEACGEAAGG